MRIAGGSGVGACGLRYYELAVRCVSDLMHASFVVVAAAAAAHHIIL